MLKGLSSLEADLKIAVVPYGEVSQTSFSRSKLNGQEWLYLSSKKQKQTQVNPSNGGNTYSPDGRSPIVVLFLARSIRNNLPVFIGGREKKT